MRAGSCLSFLSEFHAVQADVLSVSLYHHYDRAAVRHLFRVSAGLDSMLLGEAEILGQVREAYRYAHEYGATGPVLNRLFQGALEVGKRVRSETELGARPMSVASAGVKLAERIFGKMKERSALVLGAGTISEQVVNQLRDRGISRLFIMNRSRERADELALRVGGTVVDWGEWETALTVADVVVSSVASEEPVLRREILQAAMSARGNRALFLMDLGLPRNIEASAADLYNIYMYNIDDLTEIVEQNRHARESEVPRAETIVEEHVGKFLSWQASVELVGLVDALRARLHEEREAFIRARMDSMNHLSAGRAGTHGILDGRIAGEAFAGTSGTAARRERTATQDSKRGSAARSFPFEPGEAVRHLRIGTRGELACEMAGGICSQTTLRDRRSGSGDCDHQDLRR